MTRLFIILFSLTITMYFTLQAYLLKFNGKSTIDIINRLPLLFAPANYVYYLWLIVFIFLFLWANKYWSLRNTEKSITNLQTIFISCVMLLQIINLICWHYEYFCNH